MAGHHNPESQVGEVPGGMPQLLSVMLPPSSVALAGCATGTRRVGLPRRGWRTAAGEGGMGGVVRCQPLTLTRLIHPCDWLP